jgi:hypothetical protein
MYQVARGYDRIADVVERRKQAKPDGKGGELSMARSAEAGIRKSG